MSDNTANQPHTAFIGLRFQGNEVASIPVGTFPTWKDAASASNDTFSEAEEILKNHPMAHRGTTIEATMIPAPVDWKARLKDVLDAEQKHWDAENAYYASSLAYRIPGEA